MQPQVACIFKRANVCRWTFYQRLATIEISIEEVSISSFGQNLQLLRKMHKGMEQEELAEKMKVSRQIISKWELDAAFPKMEKAIALCNLFNCSR